MRVVKGTAATAAGPSAPGGDDDDPAGPPPDEGGSDSDHASDDSDGANTDSSSESNRRPRSRSPRRYGAAGCTAAKVEHNLVVGLLQGRLPFVGISGLVGLLILMPFVGVPASSPLFRLGSMISMAVLEVPASLGSAMS